MEAESATDLLEARTPDLQEPEEAETDLCESPEGGEKKTLLGSVQVVGRNGQIGPLDTSEQSRGKSGSYEVTFKEEFSHQQEAYSEEERLIAPRSESEVDGETGVEVDGGGDNKKSTSSIGGASFNFINSIIGSGIIGIPSAIQQSGFAFGIVLLLIVAAITDYTVILLIKDAILAKQFTYQGMVTAAYGRAGYWYLTTVQFLFPFFAMAGYIVIVGDTLSRVLNQIFFLTNYDAPEVLSEPRNMIIKVAMVILVMLPLCLLRNISKLEKFSAFAVFCIVFIVTVTFYEVTNIFCAVRCFQPSEKPFFTTWIINTSFVQGIGIMGAAFVCHHNTYLIYASLTNRSLKRFSVVSHISVSTSFVFCAVLGLSGFLSFIEQTQGDLLNNYCPRDPVANSARFFFACVIMLTYPIECFVGREVLEIALSQIPRRLVEKIRVGWLKNAIEVFLYTPKQKSLIRHIVLTLLLVFSTLGVGMSTNDLGVVLAFNGCFTAVPLAFIIPTACYLRLSKEKWFSLPKMVALLVMLFGVLVMLIGTVLAILEAIQSYSRSAKDYYPLYCPEPDALNATCCQLFNATDSFSTTITFCDCTKLCPDAGILHSVFSENFCNSTD